MLKASSNVSLPSEEDHPWVVEVVVLENQNTYQNLQVGTQEEENCLCVVMNIVLHQ
jgi:hypothetical protein